VGIFGVSEGIEHGLCRFDMTLIIDGLSKYTPCDMIFPELAKTSNLLYAGFWRSFVWCMMEAKPLPIPCCSCNESLFIVSLLFLLSRSERLERSRES
jgi:hypothetical protein